MTLKISQKARNKKRITRGSGCFRELVRSSQWDCPVAQQKGSFSTAQLITVQSDICPTDRAVPSSLGGHSGGYGEWERSMCLSTKLGIIPPSSTTVQTILRSPITYCSSFLVAFVRPSHDLSLMKAQTSQFVQTLSFPYSRGAAISTALPHLRFAGSSSEEEGQCVRGTMSGTSAYTQCEHFNRPCL